MQAKLVIGFFVVFLTFISPAISQELGIATGETEGTYYKMGEDIKKSSSEFDMKINVIPTEGSLDNIVKARVEAGIQLAIVQADVLYFISQQSDPVLKKYAEDMRIVMPLHDNEIHILAAGNINNFEDLENKKVAIGPKKSGTYLTSINLFNLSGVKPAKTINIDAKEALGKLRRGEIDAMIYVVGQPAPMFANLDERLNLVPITSEKITKYYKPGVILAKNYSRWMSSNVATVTVKNVIMSYNFKGENCQHIGKVTRIIKDNIQCLKEIGHQKWKSVDFRNINIHDWKPYECADGDPDKHQSYISTLCKIPIITCREECAKEKNPMTRSLCYMGCDNNSHPNVK